MYNNSINKINSKKLQIIIKVLILFQTSKLTQIKVIKVKAKKKLNHNLTNLKHKMKYKMI